MTNDGRCPDCPCCWDADCHDGYDSGCPVNEMGESACPCTADDVVWM
ncbi:hypothetical protein AB0395_43940 [Streptosporangium sp. NPDC051023]